MPDFQFLTTSNPEEFKKGDYLKQIRSHAMLSVKHSEQHQQRSKSGKASTKPGPSLSSSQPSSSASPPLRNETLISTGRPVKFVDYDPAKAAERGARKRSQHTQDVDDDDNDDRSVATVPRKSAKARASFFVKYADAILGPRQVGRGADVLSTMPEFQNPKISVWDLKRRFDDLMLTDSMKRFYFPAMDGCRHAFLSTACIKATYSDMLNGFVEESPATLYIKEEVYTLIRESLQDPKRRTEDGMFQSIGQLLASEIAMGEEDVMMTHEQGLDRIAEHRGGLDKFGGHGIIANAITAVTLLSVALREGQAPIRFLHHMNAPAAERTTTHVAESPIFCPRNDFYSIRSQVSDGTLQILRDMREMTDLFVNSESTVRQQTLRKEYPYPRHLSSQFWSFHNRMLDLPPSSDLSAFDPEGGGPDNVYEACRHAAVLYSYAIAARVPISAAGQYFEQAYPQMAVQFDPSQATQSFHAADTPSASSADGAVLTPVSSSTTPSCFSSTHPAIAILSAIQRTSNLQDAWGDLVGVLFWVTLVATTAARAPPSSRSTSDGFGGYFSGGYAAAGPPASSKTSSNSAAAACAMPTPDASPRSTYSSAGLCSPSASASAADVQRDYERAKARKSLAMTAILCTIKLGFEQPESIMPAERTFLRVQGLLKR
ncbi:hypothetical protein B0J12DRAFT_290101 [Macrophomina phaseolina]|uniref:Tachykinin family protein n=1 Tax=Macrophomina phaseolina TaxID=35725 RepID=A0ABQ8GP34_9PEZI|nr:hypothetical protein B0J12DRAFT_290101 [Macrophomina phaseolina]